MYCFKLVLTKETYVERLRLSHWWSGQGLVGQDSV